MNPEKLFDDISVQIMRCHMDAAKRGVNSPRLRSVMTFPTKQMFLRASAFQHTYGTPCSPPQEECDFEFRGSFFTIIPGDDYFFHTRCVNLP